MTEAQLLKSVLEGLAYFPGVYWRVNAGAVAGEYTNKAGNTKKRFIRFNGMPGVSDIIGIHISGKFVAIELKVGTNKPTQKQQDFIDMINYNGGIGIIAWSLEEVQSAFKNRGLIK